MNTYTETYDFLVSIIGNSPYGILAIDLEGTVIMCNELALSNLVIDQKVADVLEVDILDLVQGIPTLYQELSICIQKGRRPFDLNDIQFEQQHLNIKGRRILNGMIITTEDITKTKELEQASLNAMFEGQENERQRIAKEIHDGIGPLLSTIKLNLDAVKREVGTTSERTNKKINAMGELVHTVATDLRSISHALMPGALRDFGLSTALQNLANKANDSEQVEVNFYQSGMEQRLDQNVELGLFRIAQELINNAFKYAEAQSINIQLIRHSDHILLMVEDDGVGFQKEEWARRSDKGIGLPNIYTRTKSLNGNFTIDSSPGHGVSAAVEIPI